MEVNYALFSFQKYAYVFFIILKDIGLKYSYVYGFSRLVLKNIKPFIVYNDGLNITQPYIYLTWKMLVLKVPTKSNTYIFFPLKKNNCHFPNFELTVSYTQFEINKNCYKTPLFSSHNSRNMQSKIFETYTCYYL